MIPLMNDSGAGGATGVFQLLKEAALLLLAAVRGRSAFPCSLEGMRELESRVGRVESKLSLQFAPQDRGHSAGPGAVAVLPSEDGRIELHTVDRDGARAIATLSIDGELAFSIAGSLAEHGAEPRPLIADASEFRSSDAQVFRPDRLRRLVTSAAEATRPVTVPWVALYDEGILLRQIVNSEERSGQAFEHLQHRYSPLDDSLSDDLDNEYVFSELSIASMSAGRCWFTFWRPGVPADARLLFLVTADSRVVVPLDDEGLAG
jgi:hypothetical protein